MDKLWGLDLDTALAMAAILLGLSIAAQVLQEIYKFVTASKCRMYKLALRDFLGSWVDDHLYKKLDGEPDKPPEGESAKSAVAEDLFLRGPFQFGWEEKKNKARLLPLEKKNLLLALEMTAPPWTRKLIETLRKEVDLQKGKPAAPSPILTELVDAAWKDYRGEDDGPRNVFDFLHDWEAVTPPAPAPPKAKTEATEPGNAPRAGGDASGEEAPPSLKPKLADQVDAVRLLEGCYEKFLPLQRKVETGFEQFNENFEHSYDRRSLRQTLLLALVLTVGLNLPFTELYRQAKSLTPEEAATLVDSLVELHGMEAAEGGESGAGGEAVEPPAEGPEPAQGGDGEDDGDDGPEAEPSTGSGDEGGGGDEVAPPDDKTADAAPPAEDKDLEELVPELRKTLETILELDRRREEQDLDRLMEALGKKLEGFAAQDPAAQKSGQEDLLGKLREPLEAFVAKRAEEADRSADLERLEAELRESIAEFVTPAEPGDKQDLAGLLAGLREAFQDYLDEKSGRGRFFSRGTGHLAKLWRDDRGAIPPFLANCLVTALLISFGAPFWHRLSQALLGVRRSTRGAAPEPETG